MRCRRRSDASERGLPTSRSGDPFREIFLREGQRDADATLGCFAGCLGEFDEPRRTRASASCAPNSTRRRSESRRREMTTRRSASAAPGVSAKNAAEVVGREQLDVDGFEREAARRAGLAVDRAEIAEDAAGPANCEEHAVPVRVGREDLDPPGMHDDHVRTQVAFEEQGRTGLVTPAVPQPARLLRARAGSSSATNPASTSVTLTACHLTRSQPRSRHGHRRSIGAPCARSDIEAYVADGVGARDELENHDEERRSDRAHPQRVALRAVHQQGARRDRQARYAARLTRRKGPCNPGGTRTRVLRHRERKGRSDSRRHNNRDARFGKLLRRDVAARVPATRGHGDDDRAHVSARPRRPSLQQPRRLDAVRRPQHADRARTPTPRRRRPLRHPDDSSLPSSRSTPAPESFVSQARLMALPRERLRSSRNPSENAHPLTTTSVVP